MTGGPILDTSHQVTFTQDYFLDSTEVTQKDFLALMGVNPATYSNSIANPVDQVSWFDAALYCNARSKRDGLDTVYQFARIAGTPGNGVTDLAVLTINFVAGGYRLPTEAEWKYACHGGTTTMYWWGADTNGAGPRVGRR
jgi:formylglycine-generating enzyme required for sulfatase activity